MAHHGDTGLGMLIFHAVLGIVCMDTSTSNASALVNPLVTPARVLVARRAVLAFFQSCPRTTGLVDTANCVLRWLEYPFLLCHHEMHHRYVFQDE